MPLRNIFLEISSKFRSKPKTIRRSLLTAVSTVHLFSSWPFWSAIVGRQLSVLFSMAKRTLHNRIIFTLLVRSHTSLYMNAWHLPSKTNHFINLSLYLATSDNPNRNSTNCYLSNRTARLLHSEPDPGTFQTSTRTFTWLQNIKMTSCSSTLIKQSDYH